MPSGTAWACGATSDENAPFREVNKDADLEIARKVREFERAGGKVQVTPPGQDGDQDGPRLVAVMAKQGRTGGREVRGVDRGTSRRCAPRPRPRTRTKPAIAPVFRAARIGAKPNCGCPLCNGG